MLIEEVETIPYQNKNIDISINKEYLTELDWNIFFGKKPPQID
jgi:hypothetical protein